MNLYRVLLFFAILIIFSTKVKSEKTSFDEFTEILVEDTLSVSQFIDSIDLSDYVLLKSVTDTFVERVSSVKPELQKFYLNKSFECLSFLGHANDNINEAIVFNKRGIALARKFGIKQFEANFQANLGIIHDWKGETDSSYTAYKMALDISREINDEEAIAHTLVNLGDVLMTQGNYKVALSCYDESLENFTKIGLLSGQVRALNAKAYAFLELKLPNETEKLAVHAFNLADSIDDELNKFKANYLTAIVWQMRAKYRESNLFLAKAKLCGKKWNHGISVAMTHIKTGDNFLSLQMNDSASIYFDSAAFILEKTPSQFHNGLLNHSKGKLFLSLGEDQKALNHLERAWEYLENSNAFKPLSETSKLLSNIYLENGNKHLSFKYLKTYSEIQDKLNNPENRTKALVYIHESVKRDATTQLKQSHQSINDKDSSLIQSQKEELNFRLYFIYFLIIGSVLIALSMIFLFRQVQLTKQKNAIIIDQKDQIEQQHIEIQDSINYAERIQNALLNQNDDWHKIGQKSFVFFRPRDKVSGDFMWSFYDENSNKSFFTVADCTGHGVPGAFMSAIGISLLNEIIFEQKIREPNQILERMRQRIVNMISKNKTGDIKHKDGMDITVGSIDHENLMLTYSAANNPLYLVTSRDLNEEFMKPQATKIDDFKLYECLPNKMPVGYHPSVFKKTFIQHSLQLQRGDSIYLSSDGFMDQFGGERSKKFGKRRFKKLLLELVVSNEKDQAQRLDSILKDWIGQSDQIDDICVVGISI
ncbi:MAG: SpoIIE family protein phosphatase [Flavobacteriales bacterium]|nr:SpoIIE family protein phosphatase [Flavobacteriales bacterium]